MSRLLAWLAAGLVACSLAGCTGSAETSAPPSGSATSAATSPTAEDAAGAEPQRARRVPRPPARACYRLSYADAVAPTAERRPVPCGRRHTSATYLVGTLDLVVDGHLLAVDSRRAQQQVATTCPRRLAGFVGGTLEQRRLSMLRAVWFTPTVEESDEGADWFRCDVIALAGDRLLAQLRGGLAGVLGTEAGRDRYGMCGTAEPGTRRFRRVICSARHAWRATAIVELGGARYPGAARVRDAGQGPCEDAGRAVADDRLDFSWGYEWPTREQWDDGQTYGICWAPD